MGYVPFGYEDGYETKSSPRNPVTGDVVPETEQKEDKKAKEWQGGAFLLLSLFGLFCCSVACVFALVGSSMVLLTDREALSKETRTGLWVAIILSVVGILLVAFRLLKPLFLTQ